MKLSPFLIAAACVVAWPYAVAAQPFVGSARPYSGLFASGMSPNGQTMSVQGTLSTGWDSNSFAAILGNNGASIGSENAPGGMTHMGTAALGYGLSTGLFDARVSAVTSARYYPAVSDRIVHTNQVRASVSHGIRLSRSMTLSMSGLVSYQPYLVPSALTADEGPEVPDVDDVDLPYLSREYLAYGGNLSVTQRLTNRTSWNAGYNYRSRWSWSEIDKPFRRHTFHGRMDHELARGLSVRGGYAYSQATFDNNLDVPHHTIDAGVDYRRPLSISRNTTVSFRTGSTAVRTNDRLKFMVVGNAMLRHEIGRSWAARVSYGRRVHLNETWQEPVMADHLMAGLNGYLTRKLTFGATARGSLGTVGVEENAPGFDNLIVSAGLGYDVSRYIKAWAGYGYYEHNFDEGAGLPGLVRDRINRQSFRVSVTAWMPLLNSGRGNASR